MEAGRGFFRNTWKAGGWKEVRILKQMAEAMAKCSERLWLTSLVTKQDLWWKRRDECEAFYRTGEYGRLVRSIADALGRQRFRHEISPVSMIIRSLETSAGEVLQANVEGYDMRRMSASIIGLLRVMSGLKEWEGQS